MGAATLTSSITDFIRSNPIDQVINFTRQIKQNLVGVEPQKLKALIKFLHLPVRQPEVQRTGNLTDELNTELKQVFGFIDDSQHDAISALQIPLRLPATSNEQYTEEENWSFDCWENSGEGHSYIVDIRNTLNPYAPPARKVPDAERHHQFTITARLDGKFEISLIQAQVSTDHKYA